MDLLNLSACDIPNLVKQKRVSATELLQAFWKRGTDLNPKVNALLAFNDDAEQRAKNIDKGLVKPGRLLGVPVVLKDNFCLRGMKTTAASRILENFVAPYTAHCVQRLIDEGAIIIAKSNLDEFAMGSSNENSYFGASKNPWDLERVPGGSSGGSAVAVSTRFAPVALGSDTGGSIRQPASFCGVVGIKPTYGSVSRYGMIAFASSLDQAGTFGKTVREAALPLGAMIHRDPRDGTNVDVPYSELLGGSQSLKKCRVGIAKEYMVAGLSSDLSRSIESIIKKLEAEGCEVVEISLPHTTFAIPVYYLVAASEASSNLSRYDGVRYGLRDIETPDGRPAADLAEFYKMTRSRGFGEEVKRRILLGTFSLSAGHYDAFYTKACQVRRLISQDFTQAFTHCDFVIGPVSTDSAFKLGEKTSDPIAMYNNDILTTPVNLAGLPALSLPLGLDSQGLPMGLQVIAPAFADDRMIAFAEALEALIDFTEVPNV